MLPVTIKLIDQLTAVISRRRDLERGRRSERIRRFHLIFRVDLDVKESFFDFGIHEALTPASVGCMAAFRT